MQNIVSADTKTKKASSTTVESDALTTIKCGPPTADRKVTSFVVHLSRTCDRSVASHYLSSTTMRHH